MHPDSAIKRICEDLASIHGAHTILLYGSRADGTATKDSDYDVAAFAPIEIAVRDARQENNDYLDIFIYPEETLQKPSPDLLKLRGSKVLLQRESEANTFLQNLEEIYKNGPEKISPDEMQVRTVWALKMAARAQRGDVEGNYRRAWLLYQLLDDYFQNRGMWYEGPKKALIWLQNFDTVAYKAFATALEPNARHDSIQTLANLMALPRDAFEETPSKSLI